MQIQRIQTVFLLFAVITTLLYLFLPVIVFDYVNHTQNFLAYEVTAWAVGYFIYIVAIAAGIAAGSGLISVIAFKYPKVQKAFIGLGIIAMLFCFFFVLYKWYANEYRFDTLFYYGNIVPWVVIALFVLALRGISKDEELLKSYDRMR